jgi:hypothetical protein
MMFADELRVNARKLLMNLMELVRSDGVGAEFAPAQGAGTRVRVQVRPYEHESSQNRLDDLHHSLAYRNDS